MLYYNGVDKKISSLISHPHQVVGGGDPLLAEATAAHPFLSPLQVLSPRSMLLQSLTLFNISRILWQIAYPLYQRCEENKQYLKLYIFMNLQ